MQIILQDGEQVDSVTINGHEYQVYPYDIIELSDGRRIVTLFGTRPAQPKVADMAGIRTQSTLFNGGIRRDKDGIIGRA